MPDSPGLTVLVLGSYSSRPQIPDSLVNSSKRGKPTFHPMALQELKQAVALGKETEVNGLIHLQSTRELAVRREEVFELLAEWIRIFEKHAMLLPDSLTNLPPDVQDQMGKDLAILASCREDAFLILAGKILEHSYLMTSLRLWADPKVQIKTTKNPLEDSLESNQEACEFLFKWMTRRT